MNFIKTNKKFLLLAVLTVLFFTFNELDWNLTINKRQFKEVESKTLIFRDTMYNPSVSYLKPEEELSCEEVSTNCTNVSLVASEKGMTDYQVAMWLLKSYESLHLESYWDVCQWTVGWGTRSKKGEKITREEADRRVVAEYDKVYKDISKRYPNLDRWERLILSVMDYNVGHFGKSLEKAILEGDNNKIAAIMQKYYHTSKGKKLQGLVKRRKAEAKLLKASKKERQKIGEQLRKKVISHIQKTKKI